MWLTGFDAPVLHTLYIDKPMRDHGLLQAIARVNRVFEDKPGGLVVDYIGIGDDLRAGLKAYAQGRRRRHGRPAGKARRAACRSSGRSSATSCTVGFARRRAAPGRPTRQAARSTRTPRARGEDDHETYLDEQAAFATWFKLVPTKPPSVAMRYDHDFFNRLRPRSQVHAARGAGEQARRAGRPAVLLRRARRRRDRRRLRDRRRAAPRDLRALRRVPRRHRRQTGPARTAGRAAAEAARRRDQDPPRTNRTEGQALQRRAGGRPAPLRAAEQITSAEVVKRSSSSPRSCATSASATSSSASPRRSRLLRRPRRRRRGREGRPEPRRVAHELAENIREDLSVDWTDREAAEAKIRTKIKRLLRRNRDKLPKLQTAGGNGAGGGEPGDGGINYFTQLVLDQAKAMYRYWPEVGDRLFDEIS